MQEYSFFSTFNSIFQGIMGCTYVYILTTEWRFSKETIKKSILAFGTVYAATALLLIHILGVTPLFKLCITAFSLFFGVLFFLYLSKYRGGQALFIWFSSVTFTLVSSIMGEVAGSSATAIRMVIKTAIYIIVFILIYRYFRHPLNRLMEEMKCGWRRITLIPFSISLLCLILLLSGEIYQNKSFKLLAMSLVFMVACCYIALYHIFSTLQEQFRTEANYTLLATQMESLKKQIETTESVNEQMRLFQHDFRHYMAIQMACLEEGNIDHAKQVLISMQDTLGQIAEKTQQYTDSPFINAVISNYAYKAKEADIRFVAQMAMPENIKIEYLELAVIISNALENAWKACLGIPEGKPRVIRLTGTQHKDQYFLEVSNTYYGEIVFNKDHVPVADKMGHGYGTQSILAFAQKHHAYVEFKEEGQRFKVRLIL